MTASVTMEIEAKAPRKTEKRHYWVETPTVTSYFDWEPPEEGHIVECIEASTAKEAKSIFVRQQYAAFKKNMMDHYNWFYHIYGENPFVGLKAKSAICKHGYCNCEFLDTCQMYDKESDYDYCRYCVREDELEVSPSVVAHIESCANCADYKMCGEKERTISDTLYNTLPVSI